MGAPTVLRWDDTDAPVLDGQAGSLVNLLDKCLVDGYGSKSPLGWTREFTATNKRVFRNEAVVGVGGFFRFDDDTPDGTHANGAQIVLYESMSDVDTGVAPTPPTGAGYICKATIDGSTDPTPWVVIGDPRGFYLFVAAGGVAVTNDTSYLGQFVSWFGDYISLVPGDAFCCGIAVDVAHSTGYGPQTLTFSNTTDKWVMRTSDGAAGSTVSSLLTGSALGGTTGGDGGLGHPWNGLSLFARPLLGDGEQVDSFRGYMPGCAYPVHAFPFNNFEEVDVDGANSMVFHARFGGVHGQICIDLTASFRP